jgi:amidase
MPRTRTTASADPDLDLAEAGVGDLHAHIVRGALTSVALCERYLDRIAALDRAGPRLRAVIELNPDALDIASARDRERAAGRIRGPLHGLPILVKDNIDTGDRMQTTAGSLALAGAMAPRDAFVVARLRAAGAVILGKSNMSEWANARGRRSIGGWSSRGGLTRNPYALDRSAHGSSSGSAVAVAAGLCVAAVGTETIGSVVLPAHANGIVGLKPTPGMLSRRGLIPVAPSLDTAGPMARSVADVAWLFAGMSGTDPLDPAMARANRTQSIPRSSIQAWLDPAALRGVRIGVARAAAGSDTRVRALLDHSVDALREAGAVVMDDVALPNARLPEAAMTEVLLHEMGPALDAYLGTRARRSPVRSLADVIRFNEVNAAAVLGLFGQELLLAAAARSPRQATTYRAAWRQLRRLARDEGLNVPLRAQRLAAIVLPTGGPTWTVDLVNGDGRYSDVPGPALAAFAGCPHVTVPAGAVHGLPMGLSFVGRPYSDAQLLGFAYAFERVTRARRAPAFRPHARMAIPAHQPRTATPRRGRPDRLL